MTASSSKTEWALWVGLGLTILTIASLFVLRQAQPSRDRLPVYGPVTDFNLTNQFGQAASLESFRGKIWVANVIFTSCPGPCAQMTQRMKELQTALPKDAPVQLVSLTTDPATDTPEVLERYAERFGVDLANWWFLTGPKDEIFKVLGPEGLKLTSVEKKPEDRASPNDLFIHSTISVFVDSKGRVRGTVEALEPGAMEKSIAVIQQLLREGT